MRIRTIGLATLAGALFAFAAAANAANPRIALVIGEAAYPDAALPTTANDAGLVAQVLQAAGFDVVGARDLDGKGVREAMRDFLDKANSAGPDMQAFVYVSGRALQFAGDNYLVPIDARIARAADAPIEAIKISDFTHALAGAPGLARVVVIDGARANPYANQGDPLAGGLALVDPEPNTVIAFNAAPGSVGVQDAGDYGVYAKSLSGLMRQGGVDVRQVFEQVRLDVNQQTQGAQIPWSAGKFSAPYFIFERAADAPPPKRLPPRKPLKEMPVADAYEAVIARDDIGDYEEFLREHRNAEQARRIEAILAARREALYWRRALNRNRPDGYWTYIKLYPRGPHAYDANRRLDALAARREPPADFDAVVYEDLPPPPRAEIVYADRPVFYFGGDDFGPPPPPPPREYIVEYDDDWRDLPPPPRPTVLGLLPALAIAIPLGIAARGYSDRPRGDGRAPPSARPPEPRRAFGPPPLPKGVQPVAAPTPAAGATPAAVNPRGPGAVKFTAPPAAVVPPAGATPARTPAPTPAATPAPTPTRTPLPSPSATPSAAPTRTPPPSPSATPGATPTRTPLPSPSATPGAAPTRTPPPSPSATPGATPTRTPLPSPTPGAAPAPSPTPRAKSPAPLTSPKPDADTTTPAPVETPKADRGARPPKPAVDTPKAERVAPPPKPAVDTPKAERVAPPPKPAVETPRAERVAPAPKPVVEAPKVERVAPPPPRVAAEPPRPAPVAPPPPPPKPVAAPPKAPPPPPPPAGPGKKDPNKP